MRDPIQGARRTSDQGHRVMVGVGTAILVVAALGVAQPVFAPLAFALFIIAIVWALQARLQARLPKLVALAISMLVTIVVIGAFAWVITWGLNRIGRYIVADTARYQLFYNRMTDARRLRGMKTQEAGRVLVAGGSRTAVKFRRYFSCAH